MSAFICGMWEKSHYGSNWNVTVFLYISAAYEESHYSQLVFPGASLILLSVRTYWGPGGEQQERPISVIEATASSAARQDKRRANTSRMKRRANSIKTLWGRKLQSKESKTQEKLNASFWAVKCLAMKRTACWGKCGCKNMRIDYV